MTTEDWVLRFLLRTGAAQQVKQRTADRWQFAFGHHPPREGIDNHLSNTRYVHIDRERMAEDVAIRGKR